MPFLIVLVGLILIVTAIRGTTSDFASDLSQDISSGFVKWLAAIVVIGALGYVPAFKTPSRYLLGLVALVIFLTSGSGFLAKFVQQIESPPTPKQATPAGGSAQLPALPISNSSSSSSSGSGSAFDSFGQGAGFTSGLSGGSILDYATLLGAL